MKKLSISLAIFLFFFVITQSKAQTIPKKANKITIADVSLEKATETLLDNGYTIKSIIANTIVTDYKEIEEACRIRFSVRIKDSTAIVTGLFIDRTLEILLNSSKEYPISNIGMKKTGIRYAWNRMNNFAAALGTILQYTITND